MSTKQRLAQAIAELPDSVSIEEAVERLYRAFKLKQAVTRPPKELEPLPLLEGHVPAGWKDAIYE